MSYRAIDWRNELTDEPVKESGIATLIHRRSSDSHVTPTKMRCWYRESSPHYPGIEATVESPYYSMIDESEIWYENTKFQRFGNCHHIKTKFTTKASNGASGWCWNGSSDTRNHTFVEVVASPIGLLAWANGEDLFVPYRGYPGRPEHLQTTFAALDKSRILARAIKEMSPEIRQDSSLLVTLAELKDLKKLVESPLKIARGLLKTVNNSRSIGALIKGLMKGTADTHLTHTFGTKQTLNDLLGIYTALSTVQSQLSELIGKAGTVQTRHWSLPLEEVTNSDCSNWSLDYNWYGVKKWSTRATRSVNVTMKYRYTLVDALGNPINLNDKVLLQMGAYLDSLGVNMNPAVLWDLVPFSFVVDYFIRIQDWLEGFKVNNLNSSVEILDMCLSTKDTITTNFYSQRHISGHNGPGSTSTPLCGMMDSVLTTTEYTRERVVPSASHLYDQLPELGSPSWSQWSIAASLLTSNLLR